MGTQVLGSTVAPSTNQHFAFWTPNVALKGNYGLAVSGTIYVDGVYVWCGAHDGGNSNFTFWVANAADGSVWAGRTTPTVQYGTGYGWNKGTFPSTNLLQVIGPASLEAAVLITGQGGQTAGYGDANNWQYNVTSTVPNPFGGSTQTGLGGLAYYLTYFPAASISSITSSPVPPGGTFTVNGQSFSAGVTSVKVNGVQCASWNVLNDTQLTAVLAAGMTSGTVEVDTYAGNAFSGAQLLIAGAYVLRSSTWTIDQSLTVLRSSVWTAPQGTFVLRSSAWQASQ